MKRFTRNILRALATVAVPALVLTGSGIASASPTAPYDYGSMTVTTDAPPPITITDGSDYAPAENETIGSCDEPIGVLQAQDAFVTAHAKQFTTTPYYGVTAYQVPGQKIIIFYDKGICQFAVTADSGSTVTYSNPYAADPGATITADQIAGCVTTAAPLITAAGLTDVTCTRGVFGLRGMK